MCWKSRIVLGGRLNFRLCRRYLDDEMSLRELGMRNLLDRVILKYYPENMKNEL